MMRFGDDVCGDIADELSLCLERVLAVGGEAEPFADTEDVGIYRHRRLLPDDCADYVGCLSSHALQGLQVVDVVGYLAVIDLHQALCHLNQMLRFRAGITDGFDVLKDLIAGSLRKLPGGGVRLKECGRDYVHPFVGALGGEHHGYQQFVRVAVVQFRFRYRHIRLKPGEDIFKALFSRHSVIPLSR